LKLRMALVPPLMATYSYSASEVGTAVRRVLEVCREVGEAAELV